jgi:sigma-B regulation protein RsbU (phosphoserine phosphatase)
MNRSKRASLSGQRLVSVRWIVSGAAIALTAVTVLTVGGLWERSARQALNREAGTRLMLTARNLALTSTQALLSELPELILQPIVVEMQADQPELAFAVVLDLNGEIRGHLDSRKLGDAFQMPEGLVSDEIPIALDPGERLAGNAELLVASAPVRHPSGESIGTVVVGFRRATIDSVLRATQRNQLMVVAALLVVGALAATVLMSLLLRPVAALRAGLERIGRGDLETPVMLSDRTEFGLLAQTMNEMSTRIRAAQTEMLERERLAREVELAREIQASLLPADAIKMSGFVIEGTNRPAAEVGGDYYDLFALPDGKIALAVADVSGKGLAGCMVTSMLSALLRAFRAIELSPSSLLVRLEENLSGTLLPGTFITIFYGLLDPRTGKLIFASAGHSPTLVYRRANGKGEWLRSRGIPIGAVRGGALKRTLEDRTVILHPGDVLVQYTDGINEAFDPTGERQFGFKRLEGAVVAAAPNGCKAVIESVRQAVAAWSLAGAPEDDETMLVVSREGVREEAGSTDQSAPAREDALRAIAEARQTGQRLRLHGDLAALSRIRSWISHCPGLKELSPADATMLESGLFEVCANIIEHGYHQDPRKMFDIWWLPGPSEALSRLTEKTAHGDCRERRSACVREGRFVIIDHGPPFDPTAVVSPDLSDARVRRRGRGFGLQIIRATMNFIAYYPGTAEGNITLLGFDPARARSKENEEVRHG